MSYHEFSSIEAQIFGRIPHYWEWKYPHVPKNVREIAEEMLQHMTAAEKKEAIIQAKAILNLSKYNIEYCKEFLEVAEKAYQHT